ncbi:hypothetical protein J6590_029135 [Homalodisca vitripennis]|nr:hypothetical protein J6590_029135 [Homalodisca vitripennis]
MKQYGVAEKGGQGDSYATPRDSKKVPNVKQPKLATPLSTPEVFFFFPEGKGQFVPALSPRSTTCLYMHCSVDNSALILVLSCHGRDRYCSLSVVLRSPERGVN